MCGMAVTKLLIVNAINFSVQTDVSSHSLVGANLSGEKGVKFISYIPTGLRNKEAFVAIS
jgi:hypothetical protein